MALVPNLAGWVGITLSIVGSYAIAQHFHSDGVARAVRVEIEQATTEAAIAATLKTQQEFERTSSERLNELFPGVFEAIRADARAAGFSDGKSEGRAEGIEIANTAEYERGREAGIEIGRSAGIEASRLDAEEQARRSYQEGLAAGRRLGIEDGLRQAQTTSERIAAAERDWSLYEAAIRQLRGILADIPPETPVDPVSSEVAGLLIAFIDSANVLRESHSEMAQSFNSLVDQLSDAVQQGDLRRALQLIIALDQSSELKGNRFIELKRQTIEAFERLGMN